MTTTRLKVTDEIFLIVETPNAFHGEEGSDTFLQAVEQLCGALATLWAKERQYGGAWREQGWMGNLARIMSKTSRLKNMLWRDLGMRDSSEPVQDTLQDLINLSVFALLNLRRGNKWGGRRA